MTNKTDNPDMTDKPESKVSSFMDGELHPGEQDSLFDSLKKDPESKQCWERYHLISDALRRNLPASVNCKFSAGVMAALKDEPVILAPSKRGRDLFGNTLGRGVAGLAVAASVAVMAVVGVQFMVKQDDMAPQQLPMAQKAAGQNASVASAPMVTGIQPQLVQQKATPVPRPSSPAQFDRYLLDHSQQTANRVQGVIPLARIITYPNTVSPDSKGQDQQ